MLFNTLEEKCLYLYFEAGCKSYLQKVVGILRVKSKNRFSTFKYKREKLKFLRKSSYQQCNS